MRTGQKHKNAQIFRPQWRYRLLTILLAVGMSAITIYGIRQGEYPSIFGILMLSGSACFIWYAYLLNVQTYFVIDEQGLAYHFGGVYLGTTWANIKRIDVYGHGKSRRYGLYLHESPDEKINGLAERWLFVRRENFMPLDEFVAFNKQRKQQLEWQLHVEAVRDSQLGDVLLHYAPQLFVSNTHPKIK